ncbi:MAG: DUF2279 domain-containing protein [Flavobacteriales bacterium]|jgi:hypothetical protein
MKRIVLSVGLWCAIATIGNAQDSLVRRKVLTHLGLLSASGSSLVALQNIWYKPYQTQSFHFYNDGSNWMQMDKMGHALTAYVLTERINSLHRWSSGTYYPWVGAGYGLTYLGILELMDGYSEGWGFSWYDGLANGLGVFFSLGQNYLWNEQKILPKFSFNRSPYAMYRPEVLGKNFAQQVLKDYNGQTYWLSIPLRKFLPFPEKLSFLCLSFGLGCEAKLVGDSDSWQQFNAYREFVFSLDIDLRQVAPNRPVLNRILSSINYVKIPFPSLVFSKENKPFRWIYY